MKYNTITKLAQNVLDATTDFVQSNKYIVIEPGLTSFTPDEVITHHDLINFLTNNSLDEIAVLPLAEDV